MAAVWQASQLPSEIYGRCEFPFQARHIQGALTETAVGLVTVRGDRIFWDFKRELKTDADTVATKEQVLLSPSYVVLVRTPEGAPDDVQCRVVVTRPGAGEKLVSMLLRLTLPRSWVGFRGEPILPWTDAAGSVPADSPLRLNHIDCTPSGNCSFQLLETRSTVFITVETSHEQGDHVVRSMLGFADPIEQDGLPGDRAELHWRRNDAGMWYCDQFNLKLIDREGNLWQPQSPDWPHPYGEFDVSVTSFRGGLDIPQNQVQLQAVKLPAGQAVMLQTEDSADVLQQFTTDAAGNIPDEMISQVYRLANAIKSRPPHRR